MSTERWQRLEGIFANALALEPGGRRAFVVEQCADDHALLADALALVSADEVSGDFLTASAFERLAAAVGTEGWTLSAGDRVGAYTIVTRIGAGSSGEVWRARDERLGRDVALKMLLPHLSENPANVRRFSDEARAVGSLSHPNILAVHDVGHHEGLPYLVSECLSGQSLRDKLLRGPLAPQEAVDIAVGIARGLAVAHRHGVVHRDLKPENVFVTRGGGVKILDFGIAKLQRGRDIESNQAGTFHGLVMGTAGYISPEQALGEEVDGRADLFALGVILHEMLAGAAPFARGNTIETLHAVLTADAPSVTDLAPDVPPGLAAIIGRLLSKDRDARFQSAGDLVWALEQLGGERSQGAGPYPDGRKVTPGLVSRRVPVWAAAAVAGAAAVIAALLVPSRRPAPLVQTEPTRFSWALPQGVGLASAPALSPDGRSVVFVGLKDRSRRLFVRALDAVEAREVEGTTGAGQPFWSPDSRWVGFFARRRLMKVALEGGAPVTVSDDSRADTARTERGAAWGAGDTIVYGPGFNPPSLFSVAASGG